MLQIKSPSQEKFKIAQRILRDAKLDPTTPLHFEHTLVAELDGKIVGVGQIKHYGDCQELGSLVVLSEYQRQGIAAQLIAALEAQAQRPLYLTCMDNRLSYYAKFGYKQIGYRESPGYLKRKLLLTAIGRLVNFNVCVMVKTA